MAKEVIHNKKIYLQKKPRMLAKIVILLQTIYEGLMTLLRIILSMSTILISVFTVVFFRKQSNLAPDTAMACVKIGHAV